MSVQNKKDKVMTLRINSEDYKLLQIAAYCVGQSPSKFLRMLADTSINAVKVQINQGKVKIEDFKGILDD